MLPEDLQGRLVSYRAPLGRLAEIPAGETEEIVLPGGRRLAEIGERIQLHPRSDDAGWDSRDSDAEFVEWQVVIESLRRLIERAARTRGAGAEVDYLAQVFAEEESRTLFAEQRRRKTVDRMTLRDQPILDQYQGAVFRRPLDRKIILLGPPGSGKTTTLIRRLGQKRSPEGLSDEEHIRLQQYGLEAEIGDSWAMFSPTELLKLYVKEAFNREGVPAPNWNLRTWDDERIALGRDTFRFLRGATSGKYILAENEHILLDATSSLLGALHDDFSLEVDNAVIVDCTGALQSLSVAEEKETQQMLATINPRLRAMPVTLEAIHAFANDNEVLRSKISALSSQIEQKSNAIANELLTPKHFERLQELGEALRRASTRMSDASEIDEEDEEEAEDESAGDRRSPEQDDTQDQAKTAKSLIRYIQLVAETTVGGRSRQSRKHATFREWIGDRVLPREQLVEIGKNIQLRKQIRTLEGAARALVFDVPKKYARYKRRCLEQGKWFRRQQDPQPNALAPAEADILLLVMLRNARRASAMLRNAQWLKSIEDRYLMQVLVDEATDFSCVQLAAMLELSHPKIRSWLACGDFRQRITREGISGSGEVRWIQDVTGVDHIETQEIKTDYRQSSKLHALAEALATHSSEKLNSTSQDPDPLLAEELVDALFASWLAGRILEVERSVGRLPSIAVFVDGDDRIDPLVNSVGPILAEHNVRIIGCHDGRVVGSEQEVRVFDIQYIKGLEFEAVFLVAIDTLAERLPDLFERYLYVGITRAATFLGITCDKRLPKALEFVRPFFAGGNWN